MQQGSCRYTLSLKHRLKVLDPVESGRANLCKSPQLARRCESVIDDRHRWLQMAGQGTMQLDGRALHRPGAFTAGFSSETAIAAPSGALLHEPSPHLVSSKGARTVVAGVDDCHEEREQDQHREHRVVLGHQPLPPQPAAHGPHHRDDGRDGRNAVQDERGGKQQLLEDG